MDELLDKVAEAKGMPAALAKRSAEARAKKTGEPLEAVLAEWAGVDVASIAGSEAASAPPAAAPAAAAPAAEPEAVAEVEVIEARGQEPDASDATESVVSGSGGYPTWLAAAFVLIPLLAVVYILVSPNGPDCGVAGQLRVDEASGLAVNCDGSEFGSSSVDYLAMGSGIYTQCAACHGSDGGGGVGPAFTGGAVLATFPSGSCSDHVTWVALGSANFPEATYGATDKPVGGTGVMPGYEGSLTPEEIAAVSLFERVQFGGQSLEEAEVDCGLVVPEGEDGTDETTEAAGE
jgi:mono/diheme cytochrome c family protein